MMLLFFLQNEDDHQQDMSMHACGHQQSLEMFRRRWRCFVQSLEMDGYASPASEGGYTNPESEEMSLEPPRDLGCSVGGDPHATAPFVATEPKFNESDLVDFFEPRTAGPLLGDIRRAAAVDFASCTARPPGGATMNDELTSSSARPPGNDSCRPELRGYCCQEVSLAWPSALGDFLRCDARCFDVPLVVGEGGALGIRADTLEVLRGEAPHVGTVVRVEVGACELEAVLGPTLSVCCLAPLASAAIDSASSWLSELGDLQRCAERGLGVPQACARAPKLVDFGRPVATSEKWSDYGGAYLRVWKVCLWMLFGLLQCDMRLTFVASFALDTTRPPGGDTINDVMMSFSARPPGKESSRQHLGVHSVQESLPAWPSELRGLLRGGERSLDVPQASDDGGACGRFHAVTYDVLHGEAPHAGT